jgi:hypothetical protein
MAELSGLSDPVMTERAILRTVLYSDLFDYPLTPEEIAHYLIGISCDSETVRARLAAPVWLGGRITRVDGYVTIAGREGLVRRRLERARCSRKIWRRARAFVRILSCVPFVRMVGITGALSMDNSNEGDDVDVIIVTAPNRVWLVRAISVIIVYAGRLGRSTLCPNYLLSEEVLPLEPQNIYIAHEFVQMVPLYGLATYQRMRAANRWIEAILPNALGPFQVRAEHSPGAVGRGLKKLMERCLSGRLGDRFEAWEMRRKLRKFQTQLVNSGGSARLTRDQVKGHFEDHGKFVNQTYQIRLREFSLTGSAYSPDPCSRGQVRAQEPPPPEEILVSG